MALIKFGGGVVQMSGSIAGNTFARNRYGNYARARTVPVNPNSARQSTARARLAQLAELWSSTLTSAQRGAWDSYAASVSMLNRLGESVHLSGFNHYVRSNAAILACGLTRVDAGPTTLSLPNQDPTFAIAATADDQQVAITFDDTHDWADEDGAALAIYIGTPQLATRNFFDGPWRFADSIDGDSVSPPTTGDEITSPYTLTTGQKIFARARIIRADGRCTELFGDTSAVVAAS